MREGLGKQVQGYGKSMVPTNNTMSDSPTLIPFTLKNSPPPYTFRQNVIDYSIYDIISM